MRRARGCFVLMSPAWLYPFKQPKAISDKSDPVAELAGRRGGVIFWCVNDKNSGAKGILFRVKVYHKGSLHC